MYFDIISLASNVIAILLPYIKNGTDEFARQTGITAANAAKNILDTLKTKWKGDKEAADSLTHFEEKPDRYQTVIEDILNEKLAEDESLAAELTRILESVGPTLNVLIKIKEGEDIIGLEADEVTGGTITTDLDIEKGKKITGAKVGRLG